MPIFAIQLKADISGPLESIKLGPKAGFNFQVKFESGETRDNIWVFRDEIIDLEDSRGQANLVIKQKGAKKSSTIAFIDDNTDHDLIKPDSDFVTITNFDCRGLEISQWEFASTQSLREENNNNDGWIGLTPEGKEMLIEFEDGSFYGVHPDTFEEISITNVQTRIVRGSTSKKGKKKGKRR